jgi:hypothetical protein
MFERPILADRDTNEPQGTGDGQAKPFPILTHHLSEGGDHAASIGQSYDRFRSATHRRILAS